MQATREPRTARDLRRALAELGAVERRANPPEEAPPFALSFRPAGPGQQWVVLDRFWDRGAAVDSGSAPDVRGATDGALVYLTGGGMLTRLWVMDGGQAREATSVPRDEPAVSADWVVAWDGPRAEASWMVEQCSRVAHQQVSLALAACVASAMPTTAGVLPKRERVLPECLRTLRAWAVGHVDIGAVERASALADRYRDQVEEFDRPSSRPAYYVASACVSALGYARWRDRPRDVTTAVAMAEREAFLARSRGAAAPPRDWTQFYMRVQRKLAPRVRSFVPLGDVLLSERERLGMRR